MLVAGARVRSVGVMQGAVSRERPTRSLDTVRFGQMQSWRGRGMVRAWSGGWGGGGERGEEELLEARHADEEQKAHDEDGGGEGGHEERFAVELLGVLDGALGFEGELEIDGHGEGDEGEAEDELDAVADDEGAEEEHRRGGVEEDGDEEGFGV